MATGQLGSYPGVIDFLDSIAADLIPMAVVTSSTRTEANAVIAALHLSRYFPVIVTAEDVDRGKPDPQGYLLAAAELHTRPDQCLVVEDAPSGIQAARKAGMSVLAITNTHQAPDLSSADWIVDSLDSLSLGQGLQKQSPR